MCSDIAFRDNNAFGVWALAYAKNESAFVHDFQRAFQVCLQANGLPAGIAGVLHISCSLSQAASTDFLCMRHVSDGAPRQQQDDCCPSVAAFPVHHTGPGCINPPQPLMHPPRIWYKPTHRVQRVMQLGAGELYTLDTSYQWRGLAGDWEGFGPDIAPQVWACFFSIGACWKLHGCAHPVVRWGGVRDGGAAGCREPLCVWQRACIYCTVPSPVEIEKRSRQPLCLPPTSPSTCPAA